MLDKEGMSSKWGRGTWLTSSTDSVRGFLGSRALLPFLMAISHTVNIKDLILRLLEWKSTFNHYVTSDLGEMLWER